MKIKNILAAIALIVCGSVSAQNATKADLNKLANQVNELSQKVAQLESNLERVITENVNLVEQLDIKTVSTCTDVNRIQWDIVKVEPNPATNDVIVTFRVTNKSGRAHDAGFGFDLGSAVDSNSNLGNNVYVMKNSHSNPSLSNLPSGTPINIQGIIKNVPTNSSYFASITMKYSGRLNKTQSAEVKFTGVHIPW